MLKQRLLATYSRIRTRWRRWRLDEQLAHGADPAMTPELTLRAAQLAEPATRRRLATGLVRTLEDALKPEGFTLRLRPHRAEIRASADELLDLAARLDDDRAVDLRGVSQAALLLTPGASPLDPDSGASLRQAVRRARVALEPPRVIRPTLVVRRPSDGDRAAA